MLDVAGRHIARHTTLLKEKQPRAVWLDSSDVNVERYSAAGRRS